MWRNFVALSTFIGQQTFNLSEKSNVDVNLLTVTVLSLRTFMN